MNRPTRIAIGIVAATVDVAHGLWRIALTTTRPSTAIRMIMIASTPINATAPPTAPSSSRAIWPSDRPSRRIDQRPRTRDRREMVAEDDPAIGGHEVAPVAESLRGRRTGRVEREHLRS